MIDNNILVKKGRTLLVPYSQQVSSDKSLTESFLPKSTFSAHIVSADNEPIMKEIQALKAKPLLTTHKPALSGNESIEELLFDARANVKIMASAVSMHINPELRIKLFRQIDMLHDPDEWEPEDTPINQLSFKTFLSGLLQINPERGPGLGLSNTGNVIAAWVTDKDRLIIEFMPKKVKWVITRFINDEPEQFTGRTLINRLFESLAPYNPDHWFSKKEEADVST